MRFYTNVQLIGNQFLVRGVENGKRYEHRDEFFPTLFVKSKKDTKYRTLPGRISSTVSPLNVLYLVSFLLFTYRVGKNSSLCSYLLPFSTPRTRN